MTGETPAGSHRLSAGCRDRGSAALETAALLPLLLLVGSLLLQLGVAIWTTVAADTAARSAARAVTLGGTAFDAATTSLPGSLRVSPGDVEVDPLSSPDGVRVTLTIKVPRVSLLPGLSVTRDAVMPDIR